MTLVWTAIILLTLFAIVNLVTGVTNDAVNFLNSAVGSRITSRRVIYWVAAIGIVIGVFLSVGMMEVARKGVIHPNHFFLSELLVVFLAVMITDIILIDCYNRMGLPTSTTVALMFELIGGALAINLLRVDHQAAGTHFVQTLINTDRTMIILIGILISIFIALIVGVVAQFIARQIFTFQYDSKLKFLQAFAGGISITAISILIIKKTLIGSPFISDSVQLVLQSNLIGILALIMVCTTSLFLILGWALEFSIPGLVVIFGTFSLALTFAANDLVNYIGPSLTAIESVRHYLSESVSDPSKYSLHFLNDNLLRSDAFNNVMWLIIFLISAFIMILTLFFSKRVRYVTETEVRLSSQIPVREKFDASYLSRVLARNFSQAHQSAINSLPRSLIQFIESRYQRSKAVLRIENASQGYFDSLRASVNLVTSSILISIGILLNFPLSTTFVVFMVAMGTSIADKAWGRDAAVYRISGVLSIVGSWLLTCVLALGGSFLLTLLFARGGVIAVLIASLATFIIMAYNYKSFRRNQILNEPSAFANMENIADSGHTLSVTIGNDIRKKVMEGSKIYLLSLDALMHCRLTAIEEANAKAIAMKEAVKFGRKQLFVNFAHVGDDVMDRSQYFIQATDYLADFCNSLNQISSLTHTHILNNHKGLTVDQNHDLTDLVDEVTSFLNLLNYVHKERRFGQIPDLIRRQNLLLNYIEELRLKELRRIKHGEGHTRMNALLMEILAETKNIMLFSINILKSHRDIMVSGD